MQIEERYRSSLLVRYLWVVLQTFADTIVSLCFQHIYAQIELPDNMTRSDQANSKKMIRACVDKIIVKRRPRIKCRLSDEELVLLALTGCSDEWLLTFENDELASKSVSSSYIQHESFRDVLKEDHQSTSQQDYPEAPIQNQVQTVRWKSPRRRGL